MKQESEELEKSKQLDAAGVVEEKLQEKLPTESNPEESSPDKIDSGKDFVDLTEDGGPIFGHEDLANASASFASTATDAKDIFFSVETVGTIRT